MDQAGHQRCSMIHGVSQARTARSARGKDGADASTGVCGPPLSAAGFWLRGRRRAADTDPGLGPALLALVEPDERGDPMSPLR